MRKIALDLDELEVESFETEADEGGGGTVEGQEWTQPHGYTCQPMTCNPPSCPAFSCVSQCPHGCYDTEFQCTVAIIDTQCV